MKLFACLLICVFFYIKYARETKRPTPKRRR
jgi:hypothetical protein